jgi:integrase
MPRRRLPARLHLLSVRALQSAGDGDHSDGGGLLLRVREGSTSWVFRYTAGNGKRREMGLGPAHRANPTQAGQSLIQARELAAAARAQLQQGTDPIDARRAQKGQQREVIAEARVERTAGAMTLARAARSYHERVIEPSRSEKHAAQWIASLENHVPQAVWHKPIGEIDPPELLHALLSVKPHPRARRHTEGKVPETLRRIRQRLDAVFEDALFHRWCTSNPAAAIRRKLTEGQPRQKAGNFAALPYPDAPTLAARLRSAPGLAARALEVALLTASRTSEILEATWSEFDLDARTWTIPAARMKGGEQHVVYLPARAVELMRQVAELGLHGATVFPSVAPKREGQPMSNMAMLAVLGRLGVRDRTTVHGLCRATFSTWAYDTAAARPDVIEACLAHRESDRVKAAYNRAEFAEERRALLEAWSGYLSRPMLAAVAA